MEEGRPPNATVSAWEVGRLLSQLNWGLQLAMLNRSGQLDLYTDSWPATPLEILFETIAQGARGVFAATLSKDRIQAKLRREWEAFHRGLIEAAEVGALHVFDLYDANLSLLRSGREEWDLRQHHDDLCRDLVAPGVELVGRLLEVLEGAIGDVEFRALHLGQLVAHGVHPPDVYRHTYEEPVDFDDPKIDLDQPARGSWWLATRRPSPGEIAPGWKWFREVHNRWEELGLDGPLPPEFRYFAGGGVYRGSNEDLTTLIASVNQAAMAGLARLDHREPSPTELRTPNSRDEVGTTIEPGYLGLQFDKGKRIAGRKGYDQTVELTSRVLLWTILSKLGNYGNNACNINDIRLCWIEANKDELPNMSAVYEAISDLRSQLEKRLGLTIKNERKEGYRIYEFSCKLPI